MVVEGAVVVATSFEATGEQAVASSARPIAVLMIRLVVDIGAQSNRGSTNCGVVALTPRL